MKIIIAGAGAVGTHLAKLLSREKQDIILMDDDEEKLSTLSSNFDLMTVTASPSSISGLKEVGVKEADLFIAVTPDESRNMTACMLATNLGAQKDRSPHRQLRIPAAQEQGIFPETGCRLTDLPGNACRQRDRIFHAYELGAPMVGILRRIALILIGTKMREKAEILDIPLHQLGAPEHALSRGSHQTRNRNH